MDMPLFVKIDDYKEVTQIVNVLKSKMQEAKDHLNRINDLKERENAELVQWQAELAEVERKLQYIDKSLFEIQL